MITIRLHILKEDLLEGNYTEADICPITKAFKRAGYNFQHHGLDNIVDRNTGKSLRANLKGLNIKVSEMDSTVHGIPGYPEPEDFYHDVDVNILETHQMTEL